jgi:NADH-quinone oxidoreductase chain I
MAILRWAGDMIHGLWTVVVGMRITMRHMLEAPVTMHYPDEKWVMPETFRGLLKVDMDACIVCDLCMKACPVDCIIIEWKREAGKSGKVATRFEIDYQKCMYCGLCSEPCPTVAIWHTHEYENASFNRVAQVIDWTHPENKVTNPNAKPKQEKPAAKPAPKPAAAPAAAAPQGASAPAATAAPPATGGGGNDLDGNVVESGVGGKASNPETGTVNKVWIIPGCIVCDLCEDTISDVFHVTETTSVVQMEGQANWGSWSDKIIEAAAGCPVNVIKYEIKK